MAYHYTDSTGLCGLATSHCIWASSPVALNDYAELRYGLDVIRGALERLDEIAEREFIETQVGDQPDAELAPKLYVVSATRNSDSLNQWQGYGGRYGYAVGLDMASRLAVVNYHEDGNDQPWPFGKPNVWPGWWPVEYERERQEFLAESLVRHVSDCFPADRIRHNPEVGELYREAVVEWVGCLALQFKARAFEAKSEVRYIASRHLASPERFRGGPRGVVPYVELVCPRTDHVYSVDTSVSGRLPLPICEIVCGPAPGEEMPSIKAAAGRLFGSRRYKVTIGASSATYRF